MHLIHRSAVFISSFLCVCMFLLMSLLFFFCQRITHQVMQILLTMTTLSILSMFNPLLSNHQHKVSLSRHNSSNMMSLRKKRKRKFCLRHVSTLMQRVISFDKVTSLIFSTLSAPSNLLLTPHSSNLVSGCFCVKCL